METKVTISNPNQYVKEGKQMVSWTVSGSKEACDLFYADQCADAGKECSKADNGQPLLHLTLGTAFKYGVTNTLHRAVGQNGKGLWIAENNEEIKLTEATLADDNTPQSVKDMLNAELAVSYKGFLTALAKNTGARKRAWIANQQAVSKDSFTNIPE